jgi:type IX secretion system PorP/SprF family membrane protein
MKKLVKQLAVCVGLLLTTQLTWAQQESQFSQYMNNNFLINPAVTGIEKYLSLGLGYRNQWNGLDGSISTFYLTGHRRLGKSNEGVNHSLPVRGAKTEAQTEISNSFEPAEIPHGVGGYFFYDDQGVSTQTGVGASYAFHIPLGEANLSFGATAGWLQYALDAGALTPLEEGDKSLSDGNVTSSTTDLSFGVWYSGKSYYIGMSGNQLLQSKIKFSDGSDSENKQKNHFYLSGGYKLPMGEKLHLLPSVLVKYVSPAPVSMDLNCEVMYDQRYTLGVSYRNEDAIVLLAGIRINSYFLGYSYDINTSELNGYNNGSHEIALGMGLGTGAVNGKTLHW